MPFINDYMIYCEYYRPQTKEITIKPSFQLQKEPYIYVIIYLKKILQYWEIFKADLK